MLATLWFTPGREGQGGCEQSDVVFDSVSCCSSEYKIRVLCEVEGGGRDSWSCWEREECNLLCCQQTPVVCVCVCASYVTTVYKINVNRDNVCPSRVCLPVQRQFKVYVGTVEAVLETSEDQSR